MTDGPATPSPLAVLGLDAADEAAYRLLLRRAPLSQAEAATLLRTTESEVEDVVGRLGRAGLVQLRDGLLTAGPPEPTLTRVIEEESLRLEAIRAQLESVRALIPALTAEHGVLRETPGEPVSFRTIRMDEAVPVLQQIVAQVPGDLLWLRPDQWKLPTSDEADEWVRDLLRQGRRSRVIYPARALEEAPRSVRRRAELGEDVRILAELPGRLGVIGDAVAMIPNRFDLADDLVLVLDQPSLVASLRLVFESLWERALVVPGIAGDGDEAKESARRLLLDQLARGAKDEQIARTLGQSLRTVRRRVADLMDELGASSRFQAGVEAVRRGWL